MATTQEVQDQAIAAYESGDMAEFDRLSNMLAVGSAPEETADKESAAIAAYEAGDMELFDRLSQASEEPDTTEEMSGEDDGIERPDFWDEVSLAFNTGSSDVSNFRILAEAALPIGGIEYGIQNPDADVNQQLRLDYQSPEEMYGKEFMEAGFRERVNMLKAKEQATGKTGFEDVIIAQEKYGPSTGAQVMGGFGRALMSPTTLLPIGKSLPVMVAMGSMLGLEYEALDQIVEGEFSPMDLATSTVVGGTAGPVLGAAIKGGVAATKKVGAIVDRISTIKGPTYDEAVVATRRLSDEYATLVAAGETNPRKIYELARQRLDYSPVFMAQLERSGADMPPIPSVEFAQRIKAAERVSVASVGKVAKALDYASAPLSNVIRNIDAQVGTALKQHDVSVAVRVAEAEDAIQGFVVSREKLNSNKTFESGIGGQPIKGPDLASRMDRALFSGKYDVANRLAAEYMPEMVDEIARIKVLMDDFYEEVAATGRKGKYEVDYFPRVVKDLPGLKKEVGAEDWSKIEKKLNELAKREGVPNWKVLDDATTSRVINEHLYSSQGSRRASDVLASFEERNIKNVTARLEPYYFNASESLVRYVHRVSRDIEKRKFFGKEDLELTSGTGAVNLDGTIGNVLNRAMKEGRITADQVGDLELLLRSRFTMGEAGVGKTQAFARDLQHLTLLGQFNSAATQLADVGVTMFSHGIRQAIVNGASAFRDPKNLAISAESYGLVNSIAAELGTVSALSKTVQTAFKYTGFSGIDRGMKTIYLNSSLNKNSAWAANKPNKFIDEWEEFLGTDTVPTMRDFEAADAARKAGERVEVTPRMNLVMFSELSGVQPISRSELPQGYLDKPDYRIFYSLKSFALKQIGIVRAQGIDEIRRGNVERGMKNLMAFGAYMSISGASMMMVKDFMSTGEMDPDTFTDKMFQTLASLVFLNKYTVDKHLKSGDVAAAFADQLAPAAPEILDKMLGRVAEGAIAEYEGEDFDWGPSVGVLPVVGAQLQNWVFGGAQKKLDRAAKEKAEKEREELLARGRN